MALPSSGQISINDIRNEIGTSNGSLRALSNDAGFSTPDAMSDFYGYSANINLYYEAVGSTGADLYTRVFNYNTSTYAVNNYHPGFGRPNTGNVSIPSNTPLLIEAFTTYVDYATVQLQVFENGNEIFNQTDAGVDGVYVFTTLTTNFGSNLEVYSQAIGY
jgi:hypothetical protein